MTVNCPLFFLEGDKDEEKSDGKAKFNFALALASMANEKKHQKERTRS